MLNIFTQFVISEQNKHAFKKYTVLNDNILSKMNKNNAKNLFIEETKSYITLLRSISNFFNLNHNSF